MDKDYEKISFDKNKYDSEKDFWGAISAQLKILTDNDYEVKFYYDDCGVYVMQYNYASNLGYGNAVLDWVHPEY